MNLNPLGVMALLAGIVLLYAAVKNKYPQDIIREALGKPNIHGPIQPNAGKTKGASADLPPSTGVPVVTV